MLIKPPNLEGLKDWICLPSTHWLLSVCRTLSSSCLYFLLGSLESHNMHSSIQGFMGNFYTDFGVLLCVASPFPGFPLNISPFQRPRLESLVPQPSEIATLGFLLYHYFILQYAKRLGIILGTKLSKYDLT